MSASQEATTALAAAQRQVMIGVALVMGGCVLGGVTAIALHLMGLRTAAIVMVVVAALDVVVGVVVQANGMRRLKVAQRAERPARR